MHSKLTLSIEPKAKAVIKKISAQQGKSISKMVSDYFSDIKSSSNNDSAVKKFLSYRGILKNNKTNKDLKDERYKDQLKKQSKHL